MNKQEIEKAIKTLNRKLELCMDELKFGLGDEMDGWNRKEISAYELAISALTQQLNNGWIPCSERLPEVFDENTSETVLITDGNWMAMGFINNNQQWLFAECSNKGTDIDWTDITAWQPLPPKYEEGPHE